MAKQSSWNNCFDIIEKLGEGGNANVYVVKEKTTGMCFALKELYNKSNEKKVRFINEIHIARENASEIPGIIPVIHFNENEFWYTMPIATPIQNHVKKSTIKDIILGIIQLSETLEELHKKRVFHRDIKPSNIYFYDNRYSFGDFGLVNFPDNIDDFTKSDKGLGAIFTISPEMKRDPKHSDGSKADVFSLAKTTWMLLYGDERGFDGVYNYLDKSHGLSYIERYKNTHIVELEELLKDSTENDPSLRPSIKEFKDRLNIWINIFLDDSKAQASDWNFLNKQLFGLNSPESSSWKNINSIVEVLNIIGKTPAYNHMLFSDGGGLDFCCAEIAPEKGCIYMYDTIGFCFIVKPKGLHYEGFGENYKWNYFLLELDELNPIFSENNILGYEYLVEDTPAHYVNYKCANYGVYDYETGEPLPDGYKVVRRYIRGKFLIVMKEGPYNKINGTYDGRHGLCSNSDFQDYMCILLEKYLVFFDAARKDMRLNELSDDELERRILNLDFFNDNPFKSIDLPIQRYNVENNEIQESKDYIKNNYRKWNIKKIFELEDNTEIPIKFCFKFSISDHEYLIDFSDESIKYICKDGYIKKLASPLDGDCYYIHDRKKAIIFCNNFQQYINQILCKNNLYPLDKYYISIELIKCGNPSHLFTKQEIEKEMREADDRINNQLIIDEYGYARVIENVGDGDLYPVRHESWDAGNVYVGKYSTLSTLDDDYISSLQGWLLYLKTGKNQYMDYVHDNRDEKELLDEIKKYYNF